MKKVLVLVITVILTSATYSIATGHLLDQYFGVNLSVSGGQFNMPWDPVRGFMIHENWGTDGNEYAPDPGPSYYLSEAFDIEAMYMDFDWAHNQVVYSIITSMPNTGFNQVPWFPGYMFRAGDIRFQIGAQTYVVGTYGGFYGNLYQNPVMTYLDGPRGFPERGNPVLSNVNLGHEMQAGEGFQFSYAEYLNEHGQSLMENGFGTYVMEGKIPFASIGGRPDGGATMALGMSCNNDVGSMTAVPEPTTVGLMGLGLLGLYAGRRRFIK